MADYQFLLTLATALGIATVVLILIAFGLWLIIKNTREEYNARVNTLEALRTRFGGELSVKRGTLLKESKAELTGRADGREFFFESSWYGSEFFVRIGVGANFPFECHVTEERDGTIAAYLPHGFSEDCDRFLDMNGDVIREILEQKRKLRYVGEEWRIIHTPLQVARGFVYVKVISFDSKELIRIFELLEKIAKTDSKFS